MPAPYRLLFICSGNICRSPMAEALAEEIGLRDGKTIIARSASTLGIDGYPAHRHAIRVMGWLSMNISEHRSQPITKTLTEWADFILVMERKHATHIREHFPESTDKVLELASFGGLPRIDDPVKKWLWAFYTCRNAIRKCLERFVVQLPNRN